MLAREAIEYPEDLTTSYILSKRLSPGAERHRPSRFQDQTGVTSRLLLGLAVSAETKSRAVFDPADER